MTSLENRERDHGIERDRIPSPGQNNTQHVIKKGQESSFLSHADGREGRSLPLGRSS